MNSRIRDLVLENDEILTHGHPLSRFAEKQLVS